MGTTYNIKYRNSGIELSPEHVQSDIDMLLDNVNQTMSTYIADSELMRLNNHSSDECYVVSDELFNVLQAAIDISEITHGAFDITVGPVVNLWGFGPQAIPDKTPSDEQLKSIMDTTGYEKLQLNADKKCITKLDEEVWIDLSAIAKGYAVDEVGKHLNDLNIEHYMIEVGGEILAKGKKQSEILWRIGIETPDTNGRTVYEIINLNNQGMATSGDYRNYFEIDNKRYTHIINPDTGYPVSHKLASVSVIHPSTMYADALATAFMVLGTEKSKQIIEQQNLAVYMIIRQNDSFIAWNSPAYSEPTIH